MLCEAAYMAVVVSSLRSIAPLGPEMPASANAAMDSIPGLLEYMIVITKRWRIYEEGLERWTSSETETESFSTGMTIGSLGDTFNYSGPSSCSRSENS